ncbi:hypothetical protein J2X08_002819 [Rhizobium rosettiformans]|nr:hypothetical protein [Rhizobium rosettiformans]MDR7065321.1 hypothetical protein [Rhizobium rosettiformans]
MPRKRGAGRQEAIGLSHKLRYSLSMAEPKSEASEDIHFAPKSSAVSPTEYEAWKVEKINKALRQCEDRDAMIPAADVWERFGFER